MADPDPITALAALHRRLIALAAAHPRTTACTMFAAGVALTLLTVVWL